MELKKSDILYEDQDILVCRKHAGMAVQSARVGQMDMESALKNYLKGGFVGVVQRLDQPVEGILVFGKNPRAAAELNRQHQNGRMKKQYLAVFTGEPEAMEGRMEDVLLKNGRTNTSSVVKEGTPQAKKAVLTYRVIKYTGTVGLAEVTLQTGRHHQIRVQMAHHGMPLWGDGKYNEKIKDEEKGSAIGLCAYRLEFAHPRTGKKLQFEIEPEGVVFKNLSAY
ncbi:MAG: RluA family pseudouridine synthase [Oliverpabstia sp.]